jgi:competence protein ComEA
MRRLVILIVSLVIACSTDSPLSGELLDINQATVAELEQLPGIGPKRARSIIASRNARGGQFTSYDEILAIDGIGPATMQQLRPHILLGPPHERKRR